MPIWRILPPSMEAEHFRHAYTRDRAALQRRLRRIEGQARGIQRLVEEDAYCLDVLQQVEALTAAADEVALLLLEDHIDVCLTHAVATGEGEPYLDEMMSAVRRLVGRRASRRSGEGGNAKGAPQGGTTALPG